MRSGHTRIRRDIKAIDQEEKEGRTHCLKPIDPGMTATEESELHPEILMRTSIPVVRMTQWVAHRAFAEREAPPAQNSGTEDSNTLDSKLFRRDFEAARLGGSMSRFNKAFVFFQQTNNTKQGSKKWQATVAINTFPRREAK